MEKGMVKAYFSNFGSLDSDTDIIEHGSHAKSILERGPSGSNRIKHLKFHNSTMVPGVLQELGEDEKGGWFISKLSKSTLGRDTLIEYQEKIITEHSHGFETIKQHRDEAGIRHITEQRLWEVSTLTAWGANSNTPVVAVKDLKTAEDVIASIERINKYLKVGTFSDELLAKMEKEMQQLNELYKSLMKPGDHSEPMNFDLLGKHLKLS